MTFDPNAIYQRLLSAGEEWANAKAIADHLAKMEKPLLSQLKLSSSATSDAARETWALAQQEYADHIKGMVAAQKDANLKLARYKAAEAWVEAMRTQQATRRAEARLAGVQT